jgi:hypothetical protein
MGPVGEKANGKKKRQLTISQVASMGGKARAKMIDQGGASGVGQEGD